MKGIPDTSLVEGAYEFASGVLCAPILNHSIRVAVFAGAVADYEHTSGIDRDLLWVAALLHDVGVVTGAGRPRRFEVEGAESARGFLRDRGADEEDAQMVWDAIALHTSPQIAEARGGLTRLVRLGVLIDFGADVVPRSGALREIAAARWPRGDVEQVLASAVVAQAVGNAEKAPASSWPHDLLVAHLRDSNGDGVNPAF